MQTLISPRSFAAGTYTSPTKNVPSLAQNRQVTLQITSADWSAEVGLQVEFRIQFSTDGGATFPDYVIATCNGGAVNVRTGALPSIFVPLSANTPGILRAVVTLSQAANSIGLNYDVS